MTSIKSLAILKATATRAVRWKGHHRLGKWKSLPASSHGEERSTRTCLDCGAWVEVSTKPAPNSIDIGGSAIVEGCKSEK